MSEPHATIASSGTPATAGIRALQDKPDIVGDREIPVVKSGRWLELLLIGILGVGAGIVLSHNFAPLTLLLSILVLGAASVAMVLRHQVLEQRQIGTAQALASSHHQELEALADRIWELQESHAQSGNLIDSLGDLVVHRDSDGRIVYANRIFTNMVGCTDRQIVGRTLHELKIDVGLATDTALSDGECLSYNDVAVDTGNGFNWFSWVELSARDETTGKVSHRAIARDITLRKKAEMALAHARERAENASEAKSRLLAMVSHEIRTPLSGVSGMAALLSETALTAEQRTYVSAINTSASALQSLIEDLLDMSRIESQHFALKNDRFSPGLMVENLVELLASRAHAKGIGIGSHLTPEVPKEILADSGRLRQVLLNVIGNAVKFTETGGVLVDASVRDQNLIVSIEDTGPGLNPSDRALIFEEFEQVGERSGGSGLGLSISKRIMDAMGGAISVATRVGGGAVFTVSLPIRGKFADPMQSEKILAGKEVALVFPGEMECEAMSRILHDQGASVRRVTSRQELQQARVRKGDAVIIDSCLETDDGTMLAGLVGKRKSKAAFVVLLSPSERYRWPALHSAGYDGFLIRPVRGESLRRVLARKCNAGNQMPIYPIGRPVSNTIYSVNALSVLVAEDDEVSALLVGKVLTRLGHELTVVRTGEEAIAAVRDCGQFDVVLTDLHMPGMEGPEPVAKLRARLDQYGYASVPIVVLTADNGEVVRRKALDEGAVAVLTKPVELPLLRSVLAEAVCHKT